MYKILSGYHSSGLQRPLLHRSPLRLEILFAILLLLLYSLHRLGQLHPIEENLRCVPNRHQLNGLDPHRLPYLKFLRVFGSAAIRHHLAHGYLGRLDHGDRSHLDQWYLLKYFFLSLYGLIICLQKLREGSQAQPRMLEKSQVPSRPQISMSSAMLLQRLLPTILTILLLFGSLRLHRKNGRKKHEPGQASTGTPPAVEKSADEMLDEELRKTNAQSSTDQPNDADLEQPFLDGHAATGAELLQQSGVAESTETFDTKDPLTPFLGYVLFVLQHRNNPFSDSDSWLIFKHSEMREFAIGNELL